MRVVAAFTIMMMMYDWVDFPKTPLSYHFLPKTPTRDSHSLQNNA